MDSALDNLTRSLFAQLRKGSGVVEENENKDFDCLICPKCSDRLEPLLLDVEIDPIDNCGYQTIWWTCRGLNTKTCIFPLNMPKEVFWTRRSVEQMREGLLPLPNIHLLPSDLHHLYPAYFANSSRPIMTEMSFMSSYVTGRQPNTQLRRLDDKKFSQTLEDKLSESITERSKKSQIQYGSADSRRNVELFADSNTALDSMISLKYCTDAFLSNINSEMSRKHLVRPPVAISSHQRRRFAYLMQRYRTAHGGTAPPSSIVEMFRERVAAETSSIMKSARSAKKRSSSRAPSPTLSLRSLLSMVDVDVPAQLPNDSATLPSVSGMPPLEPEALDEPPISPPPNDLCTITEPALSVTPINLLSLDECQPSTSSTHKGALQFTQSGSITNLSNSRGSLTSNEQKSSAGTASSLHQNGTIGEITTSSKVSGTSNSRKRRPKKPSLAPICSFEDPEIQSVMKRNFDDLIKNMFGKRKKRKVGDKNTKLSANALSENAQLTPLKNVNRNVASSLRLEAVPTNFVHESFNNSLANVRVVDQSGYSVNCESLLNTTWGRNDSVTSTLLNVSGMENETLVQMNHTSLQNNDSEYFSYLENSQLNGSMSSLLINQNSPVKYHRFDGANDGADFDTPYEMDNLSFGLENY